MFPPPSFALQPNPMCVRDVREVLVLLSSCNSSSRRREEAALLSLSPCARDVSSSFTIIFIHSISSSVQFLLSSYQQPSQLFHVVSEHRETNFLEPRSEGSHNHSPLNRRFQSVKERVFSSSCLFLITSLHKKCALKKCKIFGRNQKDFKNTTKFFSLPFEKCEDREEVRFL